MAWLTREVAHRLFVDGFPLAIRGAIVGVARCLSISAPDWKDDEELYKEIEQSDHPLWQLLDEYLTALENYYSLTIKFYKEGITGENMTTVQRNHSDAVQLGRDQARSALQQELRSRGCQL
jgi:hypothetical protein